MWHCCCLSHVTCWKTSMALVMPVLCATDYIYCVCLCVCVCVYECVYSMCTMFLWEEPHDCFICYQTHSVKVWESDAMRWMQRLSNRSSSVCVRPAKRQCIHSYRWGGNSIHTHTHTHTHTHIQMHTHTNYPRGVEGDRVLSCALCQVFSHELGFRGDIILAEEQLLSFPSLPLSHRHGMGPRSDLCTLFWAVLRWYQVTTTK